MRIAVFIFIVLLLVPVAMALNDNLELPIGLQRLAEHEQSQAQKVTLLIAFLAGMVSFLSPCGFVLIPSFFSIWLKERKRSVLLTAGFGLGLLIAFIMMGAVAAFLVSFFNPVKSLLSQLAGAVLILFGVLMFFNKGFGGLDFRVRHKPNKSFWSAAAMGGAIAIGWSPCVGPVLVGVLVMASTTSMVWGGALLGAFAVGVMLPMFVFAFLADRYDLHPKWLTGRHISFSLFGRRIVTHTYNIIAGLFLFVVGLVMLMTQGTSWFMQILGPLWSMSLLVRINRALMDSAFNSWWANMLGIVVVVLMVWFVIWHIRRQSKRTRKQPV